MTARLRAQPHAELRRQAESISNPSLRRRVLDVIARHPGCTPAVLIAIAYLEGWNDRQQHDQPFRDLMKEWEAEDSQETSTIEKGA